VRIVTAGILRRQEDGAILLVRRGSGESLAGYWEFPGGKVEPDETEEACLQRKLAEELEITVRIGNFVKESHYKYAHGEFLLKAYEVEFFEQPISLSVHDSLAWVSLNDLISYRLAPADIPIAEALANGWPR
jgi:8-oxo-dGTP diphosphatase